MKLESIDQNSTEQLGNVVNQSQSINESKLISVKEKNFTSKLERFFQSWKNLSFEAPESEKNISLDYIRLGEFFECFKLAIEPMKKAKANGLLLNVWKNAGLSTDEVRNSKVLKWFLDCRGDHGQGNAILLQLLQLLPPRFHKYQPEFYSVVTECCPLGNLENRVDIEIDAPEFLLFIEVKIYANEGLNQLQRYMDIAKKKANGRPWMIMYLTKDGKLPLQYKLNTVGLYGILWRDIAKKFKTYANTDGIDNRSLWLLSQFADHIKTF